ncbi:MAG: hypothetical protein LBC67_01155 [Spirochaetales bacterium]|jgi:hypothetical protein|nr:hypothetical protein [Spirochaetales bacterium]
MKKLTSIIVFSVFAAASLCAQEVVAEDSFASLGAWRAAAGTWKASGSLVQSDTASHLARINRSLPQSGVYQIQFTVKYSGGGFKSAKDAAAGRYHGGFGIHIGVDKAAASRAWGNGKSYLLWLNLDTEVPASSPHYGFRAQVYQSFSSSRMELLDDHNVEVIPADSVFRVLGAYTGRGVPVKIVVNANDGEVRVYDPTAENYYYYFYLDPKLLRGSWVSLRTNSLSAAFSDFKVTKLR